VTVGLELARRAVRERCVTPIGWPPAGLIHPLGVSKNRGSLAGALTSADRCLTTSRDWTYARATCQRPADK
jgi:hypothetical protein